MTGAVSTEDTMPSTKQEEKTDVEQGARCVNCGKLDRIRLGCCCLLLFNGRLRDTAS